MELLIIAESFHDRFDERIVTRSAFEPIAGGRKQFAFDARAQAVKFDLHHEVVLEKRQTQGINDQAPVFDPMRLSEIRHDDRMARIGMQQWVGFSKHPVVGGRDIVRADRLERNLNGLRVLDGFAAGALQTRKVSRIGDRWVLSR